MKNVLKSVTLLVALLVAIYSPAEGWSGSNRLDSSEIGKKCFNGDGSEGFCKRMNQCTTTKAAVKAGKRPKVCGYIPGEDVPIICCLTEVIPGNTPSRGTLTPITHNNNQQSESAINIAKQNEKCFNGDGTDGICKRFDQCTTARAALRAGKRPKVCGFIPGEDHPVICCPPETRTGNTQTSRWTLTPLTSNNNQKNESAIKIARRKCEEYAKSVITEIDNPVNLIGQPHTKSKVDLCARVAVPLVLGGEEAKPKEYPHMVLIGYGTPPKWLCGGSLISERYVLSAAHCTRHNEKGNARWAKLGELDTSTDSDDAAPEIFSIIERTKHPDYNATTLYNDISLYKLNKDVTFNAYIRPTCLATEHQLPQNKAIATGWGHTQHAGKPSKSLMKVELNLVDSDSCNDQHRITIERGKQIPQGILDDSMICAGDELGKDTCQGDSGGPLQIPLHEPYCMYDVVGITSFGRACGTAPGVYTRVSNYIPWIVSIVWPDEK